MNKPDIIVVYPTHIDFPLFRYQIRKYRNMFDQVIIGFSNHYRPIDIREFTRDSMKSDDIIFIEQSASGLDWRDSMVNECLNSSTSSRVLFMEQDFIIKSPKFLEDVLSTDQTVGFREGNLERLHPAFLLVNRVKINNTTRNFAAKPPEWDHFGKFWMDLRDIGEEPILLEDLGLTSPRDWEHLAGLVHNYTLLMQGKYPNYRVERFAEYNRECLTLGMEQSSEFLQYIEKAGKLS